MRVVLYAEGAGELAGELSLRPAPGSRLIEEALGAGHLLVRQAIAQTFRCATSEIIFEEGLRTLRGRLPRGSDLVDEVTLRRLVLWPKPDRAPDLVIVLVDEDGRTKRRQQLIAATRAVASNVVVGVARPEFEAWLLADPKAFGRSVPSIQRPESLDCGQAKAKLRAMIGAHVDRAGQDDARRKVASNASLDQVEKRCRSFKDLVAQLRRQAEIARR